MRRRVRKFLVEPLTITAEPSETRTRLGGGRARPH